ncbi:MAG: hypothetical protein KA479_08330 [Saprospiraceae bacterium]|nr:hypothetical protein [Saprospiraceae bacterium]
MVWVIIQWLVMLLLGLTIGDLMLRLFGVKTEIDDPIERIILIFFTGVTGIIFIGGIYQLYLPINLFFSVSLIIFGIFYTHNNNQRLRGFAGDLYNHVKDLSLFSILIFTAIILVALLKSITLSEVIDEAAYHMPFIRWIETFPIIPGIANIEDRMGFNPSKYLLDAIMSFRTTNFDGIYALNGLIYILYATIAVRSIHRLLKKQIDHLHEDVLMVISLLFTWKYPLTGVDADFLNIYGSILFIYFSLKNLKQKKIHISSPLLFLLILLVTNKFSAIFLGIIYLFILFKKSNPLQNPTIKPILFAFAFVTTWVVRNVIISGYLIYPIYQIDLFSYDWKVPIEIARGQYFYVEDYAKREEVMNVGQYSQLREGPSFYNWISVWLSNVLFFKSSIFAIAGIVVSFIYFAWIRYRKIPNIQPVIWQFVILNICLFAIWFFKMPAFRFGWHFIITLIAIAVSFLYFQSKRLFQIIMVLLFFGVAASNLRNVFQSIALSERIADNWLKPSNRFSPYDPCKLNINGVSINVSSVYECGTLSPPCFPDNFYPGLTLRGSRIEDGFCIK